MKREIYITITGSTTGETKTVSVLVDARKYADASLGKYDVDEIEKKISDKKYIHPKNFNEIYIDDVLVVERLAFGELTEYLMLCCGKHTMKVFVSDTGERVVSHPNMQLICGNYYMTYVVGRLKGRPGIEVVIPLEGTSYLYPKTI